MAKNIEPTLKLICGYLKLQKFENFIIPEYQRGYSWDVDQCDKLWQDIEAFIGSNASDPYFFGTIIVDCSVPNKFSLIDGQQRTTTFLLLLKALLLRLNIVIKEIPNDEDSEALVAGLKAKRNKIMSILYKAEDEEIPSMLKDDLKTKNILILDNKSINELYPDEVKKIIEAPTFINSEQNVFKIPRRQKDNKYTNHFRNFKFFYNKLIEKGDLQLNQFAMIFLEKCQVIEIRSWQIEQAITMFNSLNSTGMPLSDADIISAQLYSNAENDLNDFVNKWERLNKLTNELSTRNIVNIDSVLQQFMYINRALNKEYVNIKEDGNETFDVATPGLRRYFIDIKKELLKDPISLCNNLIKIANSWNEIKDYPIIKLLLKFNENAKLYLASYLFRYKIEELNKDILFKISESLLRIFTILELSYIGYSSSKFKTFLFSVNIKMVDKKIPIDEIIEDFNDHIIKNWSEVSIEEAIIEYDKNILVFLNDYLYSKSKGLKFDFAENVNVEHIMPASGRNIASILLDSGFVNKEEFNNSVNKLGNKILLEDDINKAIGRDWFISKKQNSIHMKSGYKDSRYALAQSLIEYPAEVWTKNDIEMGTKKAAERIVNFVFNKK